ncbi:MAG: 50S ribosomal protein L15 [Candidatus Pacebacteria bacterium]|jgi:large subunit ribosomal protein L15|nr:50S ribosomal protein L15 [bacterium]MDP6527294.1 50S ribosomal protein L15 [Candidatus Paceibacterota bacterium]MDP6659428.1 50S ribosomal protein L15 [Candidatus Paceibacterota bacterium]|tara:strand:- start:12490 stop:12921 length:432 start_codon:yes stop_codon:yes gene_type:complete
MQLSDLKPNTKRDTKKRVGRGGARGKTSGRGHKGQKARAGHSIRPAMRDVIKKLPKLRGYRFKSIKDSAIPVNLSSLEVLFEAGDNVSPKTLHSKGVFKKKGEKYPKVKILGGGKLTKAVNISGAEVSAAAREAVEKAGGSVK